MLNDQYRALPNHYTAATQTRGGVTKQAERWKHGWYASTFVIGTMHDRVFGSLPELRATSRE